MKKLLVVLTTVSAMGLYTASGAFAQEGQGGDKSGGSSTGNCNISALSCNGIGNGNNVTKNTYVDKTSISVPIGSNNGNKNVNTSGVIIGGNGNLGNTITQVGNNSQSFSGGHK
jgi:hypothetical protein